MVLTPEILEEYRRVAEVLQEKIPPVDLTRLLVLLLVQAEMCQSETLPESVSADPDDDKFIVLAEK